MERFIHYLLGFLRGRHAGEKHIIIDSGVTCTDDGDANITITAGGN